MTIGLQSIGDSIDLVYERAIFNIFRGDVISPRGFLTREILSHTVILEDVRNNVLISPVRDLNYRFMVAEWLWILHGMEDVNTIAQYNSKIRQFSDDGQIFNGAYGPRISRQWDFMLETLKKDRSSRQAVCTIWSPSPGPSKDIPCTVSLQFLYRDDRLNLIVNMRSSDAWLGLPYDMFNFSQLCNFMAGTLGMEPGWLTMNLGSSHLYEKNWEAAQKLLGDANDFIRSPRLTWSPSSRMLNILKHPFEPFTMPDRPWRVYAQVLSSNTKREALEFLREDSEREEVK